MILAMFTSVYYRVKGGFWFRAPLRCETVRLIRYGAQRFGRHDTLRYGKRPS